MIGNKFVLAVIIAMLILGGLVAGYYLGTKDDRTATPAKNTDETAETTKSASCTTPSLVEDNSSSKTNLVKVTSPKQSALITNPVTITGEARGTWFFEASFPVKIFDENEVVIGQGIAQADGDWMTEEFVPFNTKISFTSPTTNCGIIVLEKDNPSGLAANDDSVRLIVRLK